MRGAGILDQRVTLRRKTEQANEYGTLEYRHDDLADVWAAVEPLSGRERDRGEQTEAVANYLITLRRGVFDLYALTVADYIVWRGQQMNIRFPRDTGVRAHFIKIECELGAP